MKFRLAFAALFACLGVPAFAQNSGVHTTWLWHLHQPIYWPDRRATGNDHYENAWDTIQAQNTGRSEPNEALTPIFDDADRVNAYQGEMEGVLGSIGNILNSGAQVNMSGALMENVQSLAAAGQLGYASNWYTSNATARTWSTTGGKPRMDLVNFTYHHAMAPLISDATLQMELQIHQRQMQIFWGTNPSNGQPGPPMSRGYFPAETCFSERMIPVLNSMGIAWTVVASNHLSRTCPDMPLNLGSGGEMCDIPNKADQLNPSQGSGNYQTQSIARGCSPTAAMPFSYQVHTARYVNPATGAASTIIVVPSDQALSWDDSYSTWDLGLIAPLAARNNPSKPALVLLAHDGDNAWSGGYSYYNQWVQQMASTAVSDGYDPTTIEQFLADYPADPNDVVHVEDGGWVFADGDFGSPSYINWNWPPSYSGSNGVNVVDPSVGTSIKADFWRTTIATENRVRTAQQITGLTPRTDQVRDPGSFSTTPNNVELAWHYYLAGLDSGFLYYGVADQIKRSGVAQGNVVREIDSTVNANLAQDSTAPTVFLPQRHPWNPGGKNYGVQYGYQAYTPPNTDFWIWTYAYDASGVGSVTLKYRSNGNTGAPTKDEYKIYAGGPDTGPWQSITMTDRSVANQISPVPQYYADYYYSKVTGMSDTYIDYYVTAADTRGNTYNSPIEHVYVSAASVSTPPATLTVLTSPANGGTVSGSGTYSVGSSGQILATANSGFTFTQWNDGNTQNPRIVTVPSGGVTYTASFSGTGAAPTPTPTPTPSPTPTPTPTPAPGGTPIPFTMDGQADSAGYLLNSSGMTIYAAVRGTLLYVATWSPGTSGGPNDHFIFVTDQLLTSATAAPPWAKAGFVAVAPTKPFIGGESSDSFVGWFNAPGSSLAVKSGTNSGQMEGVIDMAAAFGSVPPTIYVAAAAYQTADGGVLAAQGPPGNGDGNIDPNEFLALPVAAITDQFAIGIFDWLNPNIGFSAKFSANASGNPVISWRSAPGATYQVQSCVTLTGAWQSVGSQVTAAAGQTSLSVTDTTVTLSGAGIFYRVMLVSPP